MYLSLAPLSSGQTIESAPMMRSRVRRVAPGHWGSRPTAGKAGARTASARYTAYEDTRQICDSIVMPLR
jgi:hypothetical protein